MKFAESPRFFACGPDTLFGIAAVPDVARDVGVVIVVGGPQYRAGSHRQFTLLARTLAERGIATFRFDCRGMGDSTGEPRTFEDIGDDIGSAIDTFAGEAPGVRRIVLWGLCDGATAACFRAAHDTRVAGLALANPWVRTEAGEAQAYLRHYYVRRLVGRDLWHSVLRGEFRIGESLRSLASNVRAAAHGSASQIASEGSVRAALTERFAAAAASFKGPFLVLLSGDDLVGAEFREYAKGPLWKRATADKRIEVRELAQANHTFATAAWRDWVADTTAAWIAREFAEREPLPVAHDRGRA